jgi:hypothetical protein
MVGEQSRWTQFVFFVGWVVVMLVGGLAFFAALGSVLYGIVRIYQRFVEHPSPDEVIRPPRREWPWRKRAQPPDSDRRDTSSSPVRDSYDRNADGSIFEMTPEDTMDLEETSVTRALKERGQGDPALREVIKKGLP